MYLRVLIAEDHVAARAGRAVRTQERAVFRRCCDALELPHSTGHGQIRSHARRCTSPSYGLRVRCVDRTYAIGGADLVISTTRHTEVEDETVNRHRDAGFGHRAAVGAQEALEVPRLESVCEIRIAGHGAAGIRDTQSAIGACELADHHHVIGFVHGHIRTIRNVLDCKHHDAALGRNQRGDRQLSLRLRNEHATEQGDFHIGDELLCVHLLCEQVGEVGRAIRRDAPARGL